MMDQEEQHALELALKATLAEHDLTLLEVTWKKNFEKKTLALGFKVTGSLNRQMSLLA